MSLALTARERSAQHRDPAPRAGAHIYLVAWHIVSLLDHVNLVQEAWKRRGHGGQQMCQVWTPSPPQANTETTHSKQWPEALDFNVCEREFLNLSPFLKARLEGVPASAGIALVTQNHPSLPTLEESH